MDERKRRDPNKRFEAEQRRLEAKRRRREAERAARDEGRAGAVGDAQAGGDGTRR